MNIVKMFNTDHYRDRIKDSIPIDELVGILQKMPNDPKYIQTSLNAGIVGGVIKIALQESSMQQRIIIDRITSDILI